MFHIIGIALVSLPLHLAAENICGFYISIFFLEGGIREGGGFNNFEKLGETRKVWEVYLMFIVVTYDMGNMNRDGRN